MFKNKKPNVGAWEQRLTKEGRGGGRESDSDRAIDLPLQKLAEPLSPH